MHTDISSIDAEAKPTPASREIAFVVHCPNDSAKSSIVREIATEIPIAIELNGFGYAVLMATPSDLEDLAFGFALAERLIDGVEDVIDIDAHEAPLGIIVRMTLSPSCVPRIGDRVRHRASESSCGLCGIENLEQAMRPLPSLPPAPDVDFKSIFKALENLRSHQPLNRRTGAAHAAALCNQNGAILLTREDVGRHNAFDKLIGAMARARMSWHNGFALLSSRCSYELVEKAVMANCPRLVTISAPTALAVDRARSAGLQLIALARSDAVLELV